MKTTLTFSPCFCLTVNHSLSNRSRWLILISAKINDYTPLHAAKKLIFWKMFSHYFIFLATVKKKGFVFTNLRFTHFLLDMIFHFKEISHYHFKALCQTKGLVDKETKRIYIILIAKFWNLSVCVCVTDGKGFS